MTTPRYPEGKRTSNICAHPRWLSPQFGEAIRVTIDTDRIDALVADRAALWDRVSNAPFLTLNEKREAVGYGPVGGGDRWERLFLPLPLEGGEEGGSE
jgi:phage portal protein BeeE